MCEGQPVEWAQEQGVFLNYNALKPKLASVYRADVILTPNVSKRAVVSAVMKAQNVCFSRQPAAGYGLKFRTKEAKLSLWVWFEALMAYAGAEGVNKIHVVGRDVFWFHITYYVALALCLNQKLPKAVLCHAHVAENGRRKLSKSLGDELASLPQT